MQHVALGATGNRKCDTRSLRRKANHLSKNNIQPNSAIRHAPEVVNGMFLSDRRGGVQAWASMARPPSAACAVNSKETSCAGFKPQIWPVDNPVDNPDQHYLRARVVAMKEAEKWGVRRECKKSPAEPSFARTALWIS